MAREAIGPMVDDMASRLKARAEGRLPAWLEKRWPVVAAAGVVLSIAGLYLLLRPAAPYSKRLAAVATPPKLAVALSAAQERLRANPQDIAALVETGTMHFQQGKEHYADAINELEAARELGALDARIFYCLGVMYQEVGLYQFALEEYRRFLRHFPDDKEIRLLAAKLLYLQGGYKDAVNEYERLKYKYPNDALVEENLGLSLLGAKEYDRAIESFNHLRSLGPDQARRADFYLAQIDFERGDFKLALEHLTAAGATASSVPGVPDERMLPMLATTYQKLAQLAEAKSAWERLLAVSPNDKKAKESLREVTRRIPKPKKTKKG
jgi:tetratricopeptide (TPR) repeat protein